jgi:D-alanyl-D-alanine carboxypeptidase
LIRALLALMVVLMLTTAAVPTLPPPVIPATPAGRALEGWLGAFDSGDRTTYRDFLQSTYPSMLKGIDDDLQFRQMTGGFDLKRIESSAPTKIVAILEDRNNEQFGLLTLTTADAKPYLIKTLDIRAIATPAAFAPPPMSQSDLVAALRAKLDAETSTDRFSGAVLLAKDGRPVFERAYGLADREHQIRNTLQTRFRIGSMNKMFTAVATLQLIEAGKIDLNAPLGKYLSDYPNGDVATQVTIAELLDHTGGTGDIFGPQFDSHRLQLRTLQDYEKLYGTRGPLFKPGTRFDYSNYGFVLLGLVIEGVSGESYYDYVRSHVYNPAGMTSTGSQPESEPVANRSVGYMRDADGRLEPDTDTLPYRATSAGGGYSTVGDLLNFANALQSYKLLDPRYTQMLTTGKVAQPGGGRYAYGFGEETIDGVRCFGHNGGAPGMNGELKICPAVGYVIAVLANMDPPAATGIANYVAIRLPK